MRSLLLALTFLLVQNVISHEKIQLDYYLSQDISYDTDIPTPKQVISHEVGEWHVTHDKLLFYMQALAKASNRITIGD